MPDWTRCTFKAPNTGPLSLRTPRKAPLFSGVFERSVPPLDKTWFEEGSFENIRSMNVAICERCGKLGAFRLLACRLLARRLRAFRYVTPDMCVVEKSGAQGFGSRTAAGRDESSLTHGSEKRPERSR